MAEIWRATFYNPDGSQLAQFSTDPAHASPFLEVPTRLPATDISVAEGRARIGSMQLVLGDMPRIVGDQDSGAFTYLLADAAGRSQLIGLRCHVEYFLAAWETAINGPVDAIAQGDDFVSYEVTVKDQGEQQRRTKAFTRGDTSTVWPSGLFAGFGLLPNGTQLWGPEAPKRAVYRTETAGGYFDLSEHWHGRPERDADAWVGADMVITPAVAEAARAETVSDPLTSDGYRVQRTFRTEHPDVALYWRTIGGAWNAVEKPLGRTERPLLGTATAYLFSKNGNQVEALHRLNVVGGAGYPGADGTVVEVLLRYIGEPTPVFPLHIEGITFGTLFARICDGYYWPDKPAGFSPILYDATAVAAFTEPVVAIIKAPLNDRNGVWKWLEESWFRVVGAVPARDDLGRVRPVRNRLPDAATVLPELDDTNAEPMAGHEQSSADAINTVVVEYTRLYKPGGRYAVRVSDDRGDGIYEKKVVLDFLNIPAIQRMNGQKVLTVKADTLVAIGGIDGEAISGDVSNENPVRMAQARALETLDRLDNGGQHFNMRVTRAALQGAKAGDWVLVGASWLPDYATRKIGANRIAQLVRVQPLDLGMMEVELVDGGPAVQPVAAPTRNAPTAATTGVVSVTISAIPAGAFGRADYAVSAAQPAVDSGLWALMGRTDTSGQVVSTPPLPAGSTVWVRVRGEAPGKRASAWGTPASVVVPATPRVLEFYLDHQGASVYAVWSVNGSAAGVRVQYDLHGLAEDPTYAASLDAAGTLGRVLLPVTPGAGEIISARITPYPVFSGGVASGTAGEARTDSALADIQTGPFGSLGTTVTDAGAVSFTYSGNELAAGFAYVLNKTGPVSSTSGATILAGGSGVVNVAPGSFSLAPGEVGFLTGWFLGSTGDLTTAGTRALAIAIIPGDSAVVVPIMEETTAETATTGSLFLEPFDPQGRLTLVEFSTRPSFDVGWSAYAADTAPYVATVALSAAHVAFIRYRITWTDAGGAAHLQEFAPIPFDLGKKPDVILLAGRANPETGALVADVGGDSDVASHKVTARTDRVPTLAEIRAGVTVNMRAGTTPLLLTLLAGQTAFLGSCGYSGPNATGVESERADHQVVFISNTAPAATVQLRRDAAGVLFIKWTGNEGAAAIRWKVVVVPAPYDAANYNTSLVGAVLAAGQAGEVNTGVVVPAGSYAYVTTWAFPDAAGTAQASPALGTLLWYNPTPSTLVGMNAYRGTATLRVQAVAAGEAFPLSFAYKFSLVDYPADDHTGATVVNFDASYLSVLNLGPLPAGARIFARVWTYRGANATGERGPSVTAEAMAPNTAGLDPETGLLDTTQPTDTGGFILTEREIKEIRGAGVGQSTGGFGYIVRGRDRIAGIPGDGAWTQDVYDATGNQQLVDTTGRRTLNTILDQSVVEHAGRPVNRMFLKPLVADPDNADAISDGSSKRVTTGNEATGGGRGFAGFRDGTGGLAAAANDGSGRAVNRLFAKPTSGDPDTADAITNGSTRRVTTNNEATGASRAYGGIDGNGRWTGDLEGTKTVYNGNLYVPAAADLVVGAGGVASYITKTFRIPGIDFKAKAAEGYYSLLGAYGVGTLAPTDTVEFFAGVELPQGVLITAMRAFATRENSDCAMFVSLYRLARTSGYTLLANIGWNVGDLEKSAALSETAGTDFYMVTAQMHGDSFAPDRARLVWVELDYRMFTYRQSR